MENIPLPKRHYTKGERKFVGFRLPAELTEQLNSLAKDLGWNVTDVAQTALDQYVANLKNRKKRGSK